MYRTAKLVCKDEKKKSGNETGMRHSKAAETQHEHRTMITILVIPAQIQEHYEPTCKAMLVEL